MTETVDRESSSPGLHERGPAFAAMRRCLEFHSVNKPRTALSRFLGFSPLSPKSLEWFRAAEGELQVAHIVHSLGPEWIVFNAVPIGSGHADIDHSLIGPAGVIMVTLRGHAGARVTMVGDDLTVDGIHVDHVRNAVYEAERAASALKRTTGRVVPVTPLIVVLGVDHIVRFGHRSAVTVLRPRDIRTWLNHRPRVFSAADVNEISEISKTRALWNESPREPDDSHLIEHRFEAVRVQIDLAETRRRNIGIATALAVLILGVLFFAVIAPASLSVVAH